MQEELQLIKGSGLFDEAWYLQTYPDVAAAGMDPVEHYWANGAAEKRDPSPSFSTGYYLESNRDVSDSGMNPLVHFIQFGKSEGRSPLPDDQASSQP